MVQIIYIEQLADVIAVQCSLWYRDSSGSPVEIGYEQVLLLTVGQILNMMDRNNLFYNKK